MVKIEMSKLNLYSIFHGNLNYSSISPKIYDKIIDSCYWPVLDLVKEYKFKSGIEFPLNTILQIEKIDPLFLEELKKLINKNKFEMICSSKEQVVFPLVPKDVNKINLEIGKKELEKKFNTKIKTAFINEQLFSSSLAKLYVESGFKNIITIWEWASKISLLNNKQKFNPKTISTDLGNLNVIWNSYISYQKFQRYVNGEIEKNEFFDYIIKNKSENISCFPFYGSDMEIFGYKNPVLGLEGTGKEIDRFREILDKIEKDDEISFILPSEVPNNFKPDGEINLKSARFSILGKKQDKFTVTRWATCGRDNSKSNSLCYNALKKIRILYGINEDNDERKKLLSELCDCWGSDFRTHAVEEKHSKFNHIISVLNEKLNDKIINEKKLIKNNKEGDIVIFNPNDSDWNQLPIEIDLRFDSNKINKEFDVLSNDKKIISQIEDKQKSKDGSLRSVKLVIQPFIKSRTSIVIKLVEKVNYQDKISIENNSASTKNVDLELLEKRGATISKLKFPQINEKSLLGFLEHGTYEDTKLSPDFYSGHTVAFDRNTNKITDLGNSKIFAIETDSPIRKILFSEVNLPIGHLKKIYYIYENEPRVDIKLIFDFKEFKPASFRTGILTFSPLAFNKDEISYTTHNGGEMIDHKITEENIMQDESTDPRLTSNGCLGSTEGIIDFGDNEKGITIFTDKSDWYSVPMINYQHIDKEKFFFRISNSFAELDDTSMTWWKGRKEIKFSVLGRKEDKNENFQKCKMMFLGLVCISNNDEIRVSD
jgi:hypothetical protein